MKGHFETMKTIHFSLTVIGSILLILFSIIGCSEVPYTGPTLTINHIDTFLNATGEDTVCLQDGFDSVCVILELDKIEIDNADIGYTPTVHVHPENIAYVFEYQGNPILQAKRSMNTSDLVQQLEDADKVNLPSNGTNLNVGPIPEGWTIEIYSTDPMNVRVVEGLTINTDKKNDLDITQTKQIDGGVQFAVETKVEEITIQVKGLIPGNTATFHISADNIDSDDNTNILKLEPTQ